MRATLPFASGGLRELAAIWQADLSRPMKAAERDELRLRLAQVCVQIVKTDPDPAVRCEVADLLLTLHRATPIAASLLEAVADAADEQGDIEIRLRVLECLAKHDDAEIKTRALERLGDVFDQLGDRRSAIESWRPAAQMCESAPSEHPHARRLYERVLDSAPNDRAAAERLIELHAEANAWDRIPEVFGVVVRTDADRAAELLLRLEARALEAGALDHLVTMADEVLALRTPYSMTSRRLRQAKARALMASPSKQAEAAATYRAMLEIPSSTFSDEDRREFESFIATIRDPAVQHAERRWLYEWRAQHDAHPAEALIEWAEAETAHGAREVAILAYRRALDVVSEEERPPLMVRAACLLDDLGRPDEAATMLAPALAIVPPIEAAHAIARKMLADPRSVMAVANQLERIANEADARTCVRLLTVLVEARQETGSMPEARQRWYRRILVCSEGAPAVSLSTIVQGAADMPSELALWEAAERIARERGELGVVLRAYGAAITRSDVDRELVEVLGRRMVALEGEHAVDASFFIEALQNVLEHAPRARWALDRVKLLLGREGHWEPLFRAYDRAIEAADGDHERAELLDEAAFTARDLANDTERAIRYLGDIHALRPADAAVSMALERLYERTSRKIELIDLLGDRATRSEGSARRDLRRRIATLWLELGRADDASATLESILEGGGSMADVADLFERVARHPGQAQAVERLYAHYESIGRIEDVIRVAERALAHAHDARERSRRVRELVKFRVAAERGAPRAFARVAARLASDARADARLATAAYRALLTRSILAWRKAATDADFDDAAEGALRALAELKSLFLLSGDTRSASRLAERGARLRFEPRRQRELLHEAVLLCSDDAEDAPRALRIITEIFRDDGRDAIAASLFDRFVRLLEAAGKREALADLWEDQAYHRAATREVAEERACWERAAALWDAQGAPEKAMAAYRRGAEVGSEESFEALARIHASRGEWQEAADALECLCARSKEEDRERRVVRLADAYVELGHTERARACLEELLDGSPTAAVDVRERLVTLYRRDGVWRPLADLLASEALRAEGHARRAALVEEASSILASKLDAPIEAADLLEQAIRLDPSEGSLRLKLAELLEQTAQWERVVEVYRQQIALYGERRSKERALTHHRLARALVRIDRAPDALGELQAAAKMLPADPAILHDLGQAARDANDLDLAERTYRSLLLILRHPKEPFEAIGAMQVLIELASIASKKSDPQRAANLLESALDRALANSEDTQAVERALRGIGRHELVVRAVETRVRHASAITARALALGELAELWSEHLKRDAELEVRIRGYAERLAAELRLLEPAAATGLADDGAWTALLAVHASLGDQATLLAIVPPLEGGELATWLARHLKCLGRETPAHLSVAWRLARALEQADRTKDAMVVYESLLEQRPAEREAARMLAERLESLGSARVADALELCMEVEPESAGALAPRLIELRDAQGDGAGLVRALELALAADPNREPCLERLVDIHVAREDWLAVTRVLRRAQGARPNDPARILRLVDAYCALGDLREAMGLLDGAIARDPRDAELLCLRARVRESAGDHDGAVSDLRSIGWDDAARVDSVLAILQRIVASAAPTAREEYSLVLADVLLGARRLEGARDLLEALLDRNPQQLGALERVASLAAIERRWDRAVDAYTRLVQAVETSDPAALARFVVALADACEEAGRPADARDALERALSALPDDLDDKLDVAGRLERICDRAADYERLSELLAARAERSSDACEKAALLLRAASVLPEKTDAACSRALGFLERARAADPTSIEAALAAAQLSAKLGRAHDARAILAEVVEQNRTKRSSVLATVYLELGKAHLALDELVEAYEALKAGFAIDVRGAELAMLLGLVAIDLDDEKTAERALLAVATHPSRTERAAPAEKARAFYHLASMAHARGDLTKARSWASKAVSMDRSHEGALLLHQRLEVRPLAVGQR